VKLNVIFYDY